MPLRFVTNILDAFIAGQKPPINPAIRVIIIGNTTELKSATGEIKVITPSRLETEDMALAAQKPRATPRMPPTNVMKNALNINIWITKFLFAPIPLKILMVGV